MAADPQTLTLLGTQALQRGRIDEGLRLLATSLDADPNQPAALSSRGIGLAQLKRFEESLASFDRSIALKPDFAEAYNNRGKVLQALKRFDEAVASFDRAIALRPDYADAHHSRGLVLQAQGRTDDAMRSFDHAIAFKPDFIEALVNRGILLKGLNRPGEAVATYDRVIALRPDHADAWNNRGVALMDLSRLPEALESFDRAVALKPDLARAHTNRGIALRELKRLEEAVACFDRTVALEPTAESCNDRGIALRDLGRLEEAMASFDQSLALRPTADAWSNRGNVLRDLGRFDEAMAHYDRAIALDPDYAFAWSNKSLLTLLLGDFIAGWRLYEWRWKAGQKDFVRELPRPLWLGDQPIAGKTVLLHAEQGLGDTIQCCRYAPLLENMGARVIIEVPVPLAPLMRTLKGSFIIVEGGGNPIPPFDLHCPMMSLPLAFGTTLSTIPAQVPYLFVDDHRQRIWRERLGPRSRPRIGLVWSGTPGHRNDRNRSLRLHLLKPLLGLPYEFHSLQKEVRPEDAPVLVDSGIRSHADELADFGDTAALIQEMDLVISVDTSVAHLAGALGQTVWVLLPFIPDFRWLLGRTDSPWYPTATLFRQPAIGDWTAVIETVTRRMEDYCCLPRKRCHPRASGDPGLLF